MQRHHMKDQHTPVMQSQNVKGNKDTRGRRVSPKMTPITNGVNRCARDNCCLPCLFCLPFDNIRVRSSVRSSVNLWLIVLAELGPTQMKQRNAAKKSVSNWIVTVNAYNGI